MKSQRNIARQLFGLTLTLVGLMSWNTLPIHASRQAVQAATRASVTEPTGQQVSRAVANGRVAFVSSEGNVQSDIYTMNPDGSDRKQLTFSQEYEGAPVWSPDGTKIAFASVHWNGNVSYSEIFVMNADGSDQRRLTQSKFDHSPTWSPDGTKIAFSRIDFMFMPSSGGIFVMNADGSDQRAVASTSDLQEPAWSPDGLKFAVIGIGASYATYLINVDGSNRTQITQPSILFEDHDPAWSPDGSKITFTRCVDANGFGCWDTTSHLWVVNADGSNPTKLTDTQAWSHAWSPDGTKIIFGNAQSGGDLLVMNPDGSGLTNITNTDGKHEHSPSWQALPLTLPNPIDDPQFFVRQHYLDFLGREPDTAGFNDWVSVLNGCGPNQGGLGSPPGCDRVHVSSGFFRSTEFGERGYWIYRFFESALGRRPQFAEFMPEMKRLSGLMTNAEQEALRADFIARFMQLPEFNANFSGLTDSPSDAAAFIAKLEQVGRVTLPATATTQPGQPPQYGRQQLIDLMSSGQFTAAQTLRAFIEQKVVWDTYFYRAFVAMQYFGYLRRDPEAAGYDDWVRVLTFGDAPTGIQPGDYRHLIFGFIYSVEYRERFGRP